MNKVKHDFYIPEKETKAFDKAHKHLMGNYPLWYGAHVTDDGEMMHICTLSVSKYELLYLRLAVSGGRFIDLEACARAEFEAVKRQQSQSDTVQSQMA